MGVYYNNFINKWENQVSSLNGFFGLRDFYNYVKYVCSKMAEGAIYDFDKYLDEAIKINFDGQ